MKIKAPLPEGVLDLPEVRARLQEYVDAQTRLDKAPGRLLKYGFACAACGAQGLKEAVSLGDADPFGCLIFCETCAPIVEWVITALIANGDSLNAVVDRIKRGCRALEAPKESSDAKD